MVPKKRLATVDGLQEIPAFASEAEEHAFWASHELADALWEQAEPLGPGELPPARPPTSPVVIRLDEATLKRLKALARRLRKSYQTLLQEIVIARLAEEEQRVREGEGTLSPSEVGRGLRAES